ncbi:MAG: hypothetical protein NXI27_25325 [Alphaproteobacteria bacterium]|nr:hypothetical protein [Alphaproteobacteria bacterium]
MAIGYIANAAGFTAIIFGISPYFSDNSARSLIVCYDTVIEACSHAENPYCAFERLESCDELQAQTTEISASLSDSVASRRQRAMDLVAENHATVTADQRTVRLIPLDEIWRSQGS